MNIVILAGGAGPEREVSLASGSRIAKALIEKGYKICLVDLYYGIDDFESIVFTDDLNAIRTYSVNKSVPENIISENSIGKNVLNACRKADAVYLALHGDVGENGKLQALLSLNNIQYTGSYYDGCYLSMNKNISKLIAEHNKIKTPKWCLNTFDSNLDFPCVVKPSCCGSSVGVTIVNDMAELYSALQLAKKYDDEILIEQYIKGREFSVGILDDKPLPPIEIVINSGFYDYDSKYQGNTEEICPAKISPSLTSEMQELALRIHKLLKLKYYSRVDFIVDEYDNIYFIEANSLPGMTPTSLLPQEAAVTGIDYNTLCSKILMNVFEK